MCTAFINALLPNRMRLNIILHIYFVNIYLYLLKNKQVHICSSKLVSSWYNVGGHSVHLLHYLLFNSCLFCKCKYILKYFKYISAWHCFITDMMLMWVRDVLDSFVLNIVHIPEEMLCCLLYFDGHVQDEPFELWLATLAYQLLSLSVKWNI